MLSTHATSAMMQSRRKPEVDTFSEKATIDYMLYKSVDNKNGFVNPMLMRNHGRN